MGYDGSGNYSRERNFSADASAGIKILASAMDQEMDDFASAMGLALLRDGQAAATDDIPMGGNRLTNVGGPTSASNYTRASELISNVPIYMVDAESSTDRISVSAQYFTTASAGASPAGGTGILIKMGSNKGSAPAIYLNTGDGNPYSANVVLNDASALYSGAIVSGGIYEFIFASAASVWHLMNPSFRIATTDTPGLVEAATTAEAIAGTDTTRYITPAVADNLLSAGQATTASAGIIEIATTAEVTAGADTGRAVTPATLDVVVSTLSSQMDPALSAVPLLAKFIYSPTSSDTLILAANYKASALTVTSGGVGAGRVGYGIDLASANGGVINISIDGNGGAFQGRQAVITSAGISTMTFTILDLSASAASVTTDIFFSLHRIF